MPQFNFDRRFQIGVLGLMSQNYDFLIVACDVIIPDYFEDKILGWFFQTIRNYFMDFQQRPTSNVIWNEVLKATKSGRIKDTEVSSYVEIYKQLENPVDEKEYVIKEVVSFCRRQALRKTFLEVAPQINSDDPEVFATIEEKVRAACNLGTDTLNIGTQYFMDIEERLRIRALGDEFPRAPTGITELDNFIGGGIKPGQLCVWIAGTGIGKSIALCHVGKRSIVQGYKIVHYTLELNEADIAERYDASWSNIDVYDLSTSTQDVKDSLEKFKNRYGNSKIIKFYPTKSAGISTIKAHLNQLRSNAFNPDLVIVDYGDLLKHSSNYNDEYSDLGNTFAELRGLAGELNIPLITATQANRAGNQADELDLGMIGDSFKKAQIADCIIGICMSKEEKQNDMARLVLLKNRNGPTGISIKINTDYKRMCFYNPRGGQTPAVPVIGAGTTVGRRVGSTKQGTGHT